MFSFYVAIRLALRSIVEPIIPFRTSPAVPNPPFVGTDPFNELLPLVEYG